MAISLIETASLDTGLVAPTATALTTASGSAPSYSARAWVNFNGTGTVAIRASGNVSSITDNGTGDYTVNFTTAMADANYAFSAGTDNFNQVYPRGVGLFGTTPTTSGIRLKQAYTLSFASSQTFEDTAIFTVIVFR
jgi:hypothetical protein